MVVTLSSHGARTREIVAILGRHGIDSLGRPSPLELRVVLEELGPTFVKLGQILSTRPDLLPEPYIRELSGLLTGAAPVAGGLIVEIVEEELGSPTTELFASFDREPLASASIGQAHAAILHDGTSVVVKVRKPGAVETIRQDLEILTVLAARASRASATARSYDLEALVADFDRTITEECDYLREAANAAEFRRNFVDDRTVRIPAVFPALSTSRVLTLERIRGIRVDDLEALDSAGIERAEVMSHSIDIVAKMVFDDGFFHADPHPGNLFVQDDGGIGLIDFGMVGRLDDDERGRLTDLFEALIDSDPAALDRALRNLDPRSAHRATTALDSDLERFMALYRGRDLRDVHVSALITQMLGILRRHRIRVPASVTLLLRMLTIVEGLGLALDPAFSLGTALRPAARRLLERAKSPAAILGRVRASGREALLLGEELPAHLRKLLDLVDESGFEVHLRAHELEPLVGRLERVGTRVVAGLVVSALITGLGSLAGQPARRSWRGPLWGIGIGAIGALGTYLTATSRPKRAPDGD